MIFFALRTTKWTRALALDCSLLIAHEEEGYSCPVYKWQWTESTAVAHWFFPIGWVTLYRHQGSDCQMSPQYGSSNHLFTPHYLAKWKIFLQLLFIYGAPSTRCEVPRLQPDPSERGKPLETALSQMFQVTKLQNTCRVMLQGIRDSNRLVQDGTGWVASTNNLHALE